MQSGDDERKSRIRDMIARVNSLARDNEVWWLDVYA